MSVYQNINGTLTRMDASDLVQLAAVDTEGILGGTPGATTDGQTLVDQLAADDVQAQTDIGQIKTDLSDYHVVPSRNHIRFDNLRASSANLNVTITENSIRIANPTAGTYRNAAYFMPVEANTDYVIKTHAVVTSGVACLNVFTADAQTQIASTSRYSSDADIELSFNSGSQTMIIVSFFSAFDTSASGDVLYQNPLLYTASDYAADPSYVPHWECMRDGMFPRLEQRVLGAKNLLDDSPFTTQVVNGVTYTKNDDGTISVTGTVTAGQTFAHAEFTTDTFPAGSYIYTDKVNNEHAGTIIRLDNSSGTVVANTLTGQNIYAFTLTNPHKLNVRFYRDNNETGNYIIKPMIRVLTDTDDAYVPYAMTNRELTGAIQDVFSCSTDRIIASNTNLNNITKPGMYYCVASATAQSLTNCPVTTAFGMAVYDANGVGTFLVQEIQFVAGGSFKFMRVHTGTWSSWYKFTGTAV